MAVPSGDQRIKILAILDTIHDFYKERGVASDDEEDIDAGKMLFIREFIAKVIREYIRADPNLRPIPPAVLPASVLNAPITDEKLLQELNNLVIYLTGGKIRSISSNFEPQVVKCFEEWYPFELSAKTKREDTYDDIVAAKDAKIAEYNRVRGVSDILILTSKDLSSFGALTGDQRRELADFIQRYFFENPPLNPYFTFDGKAGIVSKVFKEIQQSRNIIYPQTIADSAPTSFNSFHGRNSFIFPNNPEMRANSNIYTSGKYIISYVNNGFDNKHPFNFSIRIARTGGVEANPVDIQFSVKQTEGPSVNYLISLLQVAETPAAQIPGKPPGVHAGILNTAQSSKTTTLRIGDTLNGTPIGNELCGLYNDTPRAGGVIRLLLKALMLDIKRTGDNEQARAILTELDGMFCSIDHLSVLYARLNRKNSIFHVGEKMILFRFPTVQVDPEIQRVNAAIWKAKQAVELLDKMIPATTIEWGNLVAQTDLFSIASRRGVANTGVGPYELVTKLLRLKMIDIVSHLDRIGAIGHNDIGELVVRPALLNGQNLNAVDNGEIRRIAAIQPGQNIGLVPAQGVNLATANANAAASVDVLYTNISNAFNAYFAVVNSLNITTTSVISKPILNENQFIGKRNHELFKYNTEPFIKLGQNIQNIISIGERVRGGRYREKTGIISILQLMGYFTNVENIINQFYDDNLRDTLRQILDVNTRCDHVPDEHKLISILNIFNIPVPADRILVAAQIVQVPNIAPPAQPKVPVREEVEAAVKLDITRIDTAIDQLYTNTGLPQYPVPDEKMHGGMHVGGAFQLYKQKGGAYNQRYSDLNDLVRNICAMATIYIEGVYQEHYDINFAEAQRNVAEKEQIFAASQQRAAEEESRYDQINSRLVAIEKMVPSYTKSVDGRNAHTKTYNELQLAQEQKTAATTALHLAYTELTNATKILHEADYNNITPWHVITYFLHNPNYIISTKNIIERLIAEYEIGMQEINFKSDPLPEYTSGESILSYILSFKNSNIIGEKPLEDRTTFLNIDRRIAGVIDSYKVRFENRIPLGINGFPMLEGLQLMILHFLHFGFSTPVIGVQPPEAATMFRTLVTQSPPIAGGIDTHIEPDDYASFERCGGKLMSDLQKIMNKLRFNQNPYYLGGDNMVGGTRKPRRNRTRKFHVKRRRTIKRRRS